LSRHLASQCIKEVVLAVVTLALACEAKSSRPRDVTWVPVDSRARTHADSLFAIDVSSIRRIAGDSTSYMFLARGESNSPTGFWTHRVTVNCRTGLLTDVTGSVLEKQGVDAYCTVIYAASAVPARDS